MKKSICTDYFIILTLFIDNPTSVDNNVGFLRCCYLNEYEMKCIVRISELQCYKVCKYTYTLRNINGIIVRSKLDIM